MFCRILLAGLTGAIVWSQVPAPRLKNPYGLKPEAVAEGKAIYNRSCTICHGLDGEVGDRAPALAGTRRFLRRSDADLYEAVRHGIPGTLMPPTSLPENDVWKVVSYVRSLRATAHDMPPDGNAAAGEQIFLGEGGCTKCHMMDGRGGVIGPDLSNIGAERTVQAIRAALTEARPFPPKGYVPVRLTTKDGTKVDGVVKNENNFSLQVLDRGGRLHLLLRDEIASIAYGQKSLMPSDWDKRLGPEKLRDLVAYLSRRVAGRNVSEREAEH